MQVFASLDNLQRFARLRTRYLLSVLKEASSADKLARWSGKHPHLSTLVSKLGDVAITSEEFDLLVTFDSVQFAQTWAREWSNLLVTCKSPDELFSYIKSLNTVVEDSQRGTSLKSLGQKKNTGNGKTSGLVWYGFV